MTGKPTRVKGQVEEVVGILTHNKDLEKKGRNDRRVGEVKEKVSRVKSKVEAAADKMERKAGKVIDKTEGLKHQK